MPKIAFELNLSSPTVLQIINELKEARLVEDAGELKSTGGRKAKAISVIRDARYAVGMDITRNHITLALTDMSRSILSHKRIQKPFLFADSYFRAMGDILKEFLAVSGIDLKKIQGVGISLPAIIDGNHDWITNSGVLGLDAVRGTVFTKYIPYPCILLNDANAGVFAECSRGGLKGNMAYLSLSNSVGGSFVYGKEEEGNVIISSADSLLSHMYLGDNWRAGEFGHIVIHPGGKQCYCGKKGCLDAYCSALCLADPADGNLELFFKKMEEGDRAFTKIWKEYLNDLAIGVDNLRMCYDCEIVLGGYVGSQIEPYIPELRKKLAERNIFGDDGSYVRACSYRIEASALGAAIYTIEDFIDSI